jgi:hypothetical protein
MVNIRNASSCPFHIFDCHIRNHSSDIEECHQPHQQARHQRNHDDVQLSGELRRVRFDPYMIPPVTIRRSVAVLLIAVGTVVAFARSGPLRPYNGEKD